MTKQQQKTRLMNAAAVRSIESAAWSNGVSRGLRVSRAIEATVEAGIPWDADAVDTVEQIHAAHSRIVVLSDERAPLALSDLLADDAIDRVRAAIALDEQGQRRGTVAQHQLTAAAIAGTQSAILAAVPATLARTVEWLQENADARHLHAASATLPRHLASKVTAYGAASTSHVELLKLDDYTAFEDLERGDHLHRLYRWTDEQVIALNKDMPLLGANKDKIINPQDHWIFPEVEYSPVASVAEWAARTTRANDLAEAWDAENRAKVKQPW